METVFQIWIYLTTTNTAQLRRGTLTLLTLLTLPMLNLVLLRKIRLQRTVSSVFSCFCVRLIHLSSQQPKCEPQPASPSTLLACFDVSVIDWTTRTLDHDPSDTNRHGGFTRDHRVYPHCLIYPTEQGMLIFLCIIHLDLRCFSSTHGMTQPTRTNDSLYKYLL